MPHPRRQKSGFILAMAICFCFVMVIIAVVVANSNRALHGFAESAEAEAQETEGALAIFAQLRGALQGNGNPSAIGLSSTPAASGTLTGSADDSNVSGKYVYQALGPSSGPDGYSSGNVSIGSGISVPTDCSAAIVTSQVPNQPYKQQYACVLSGNYPYGMLATSGTLAVKSVRSVNDYSGQDANITGLMADVFAQGSVSIGGQLNGRAYSQGSASASQGGILYPNWPNAVAMPADFAASLTQLKSSLTTGSYGSGLSKALDDLHSALAVDFSTNASVIQPTEELMGPGKLDAEVDPKGSASGTQATVNSPGGTNYDNPGGTLTVGTSLNIPAPSEEITFNTVNIAQDLLIADGACFHVKGDLTVTGVIRLGKNATLTVDGQTTAAALSLTYSLAGSSNVGIISTFYGQGQVTLTGAMTQASATFLPSPPTATSDPFPTTLTLTFTVPGDPPTEVPETPNNPLADQFLARQASDMATLTPELAKYLGTVTALPGSTTDVPGVLLTSDNSLTLGSGAKASGLMTAPTVTISASQTVGAVWGGTIQASSSDFRYFPYFTHAYPATPGNSSTTVSAIDQHPIAYGKIP